MFYLVFQVSASNRNLIVKNVKNVMRNSSAEKDVWSFERKPDEIFAFL